MSPRPSAWTWATEGGDDVSNRVAKDFRTPLSGRSSSQNRRRRVPRAARASILSCAEILRELEAPRIRGTLRLLARGVGPSATSRAIRTSRRGVEPNVDRAGLRPASAINSAKSRASSLREHQRCTAPRNFSIRLQRKMLDQQASQVKEGDRRAEGASGLSPGLREAYVLHPDDDFALISVHSLTIGSHGVSGITLFRHHAPHAGFARSRTRPT